MRAKVAQARGRTNIRRELCSFCGSVRPGKMAAWNSLSVLQRWLWLWRQRRRRRRWKIKKGWREGRTPHRSITISLRRFVSAANLAADSFDLTASKRSGCLPAYLPACRLGWLATSEANCCLARKPAHLFASCLKFAISHYNQFNGFDRDSVVFVARRAIITGFSGGYCRI